VIAEERDRQARLQPTPEVGAEPRIAPLVLGDEEATVADEREPEPVGGRVAVREQRRREHRSNHRRIADRRMIEILRPAQQVADRRLEVRRPDDVVVGHAEPPPRAAPRVSDGAAGDERAEIVANHRPRHA
jgi:hypothetical protein